MKKIISIILALAMISMAFTAFAVEASAEPWYFFKEAEDFTSTPGSLKANDGMTVQNCATGSGGKGLTFISSEETDVNEKNRFSFEVEIPKDGSYTLWLRILASKAQALNLVHTANSSIFTAAGSTLNTWIIPAQASASPTDPVMAWYKLDVTSKKGTSRGNITDGFVSLKVGKNTVEFSSWDAAANKIDARFMFDCAIMTDDASFDPNTDDWETVRDAANDPVPSEKTDEKKGNWYGFKEIESAKFSVGDDGANAGFKTVNVDTASGGQMVSFIGSAEADISRRNRFTLTVRIPHDGTYAVWMRALVASPDKCDLYHTASSAIFEATGKTDGVNVWHFEGIADATPDEPIYGWYKLNVTDKKQTKELAPNGTVDLKAGYNTIELSTRAGVDKAFKFDCMIITDNLNFDPHVNSWTAARENALTGDMTPYAAAAAILSAAVIATTAVVLKKKKED